MPHARSSPRAGGPAVLSALLGQANVAMQARYDHGYRSEAEAVAADVASILLPREDKAVEG